VLAEEATGRLGALDITNAAVINAPHASGLPSEAPFDISFINGRVPALPRGKGVRLGYLDAIDAALPLTVGNRLVLGLLHQPRLAQAVGKGLGLPRVLVRHAGDMLNVGVAWIYFLELSPNLASLFQFAQVAQR
jgi:hypothetical protein